MKERRRVRDDKIRNSRMRMRVGYLLACRDDRFFFWNVYLEGKNGFLIRATKQSFALPSQAFDWMIAFVLKGSTHDR